MTERLNCDKCVTAKAMYQAKGLAGDLFFCGHHYNEFKEGLDKWSYEVVELDKIEEDTREKAEISGSTN
jgi:hypothetical protein